MNRNTYAHVDTVGGAGMTLAAQKYGGFVLNGSAGAATLSILDGAKTIISTSAAVDAYITVVLNHPIAFTTSLVAVCSGTGFYSVFVSP